MGFLGLGKKKKKEDVPTSLDTIPLNESDSPDLSIPAPDLSLPDAKNTLSPGKSPSDSPSSINVPSTQDITSSKTAESTSSPEFTDSANNPSLDLPDTPSEDSFNALPDFSEDDFTPPKPPIKTAPVLDESLNAKKESTESSESSQKPVPPKHIKSYADSQGVFVSRHSYITVLDSLKKSTKLVNSLSSAHKNLISFDVSTKKLLDTQATAFEDLHKDVLAILPFISKK